MNSDRSFQLQRNIESIGYLFASVLLVFIVCFGAIISIVFNGILFIPCGILMYAYFKSCSS